MGTPTDHRQIAAERLISGAIIGTWAFYAIGALYIVGPALGWILAAMACSKLYFDKTSQGPLPYSLSLWLWAMAAMLVVLWIGHINFELGVLKTIKSSIGWAKGWALLALFPFSAWVLNIRVDVVARAICKLSLQSLILLPIFFLAPFAGLPEALFVSPLKIVGGSGPEYFTVQLYTIEPDFGRPRWQFFAPWSPAAGMIALIHFLCALVEKNRRWRIIGLAASFLIILLCQSRLALVALLLVTPVFYFSRQIWNPALWFGSAAAIFAAALFFDPILYFIETAVDEFRGVRAASSRVRDTLGRIAIERWWNEAPWFGHGIVERGPHLVEYMPIGSHHSWYGLLFVKGALGCLALALPMMASLFTTLTKALKGREHALSFALIVTLLLYSFGENLEILSYLYWPALIVFGATYPKDQAT